jgi:predicted transcriptional regulator
MRIDSMNIMELKSDLHQLIDKINDDRLLHAVKVILSKEPVKETDLSDTLSEELKTELEASILEADQGKTISHEEAMRQIKSRYNL